jgi:3-dehydroquinate dehydratase type I
MICVSLAEPSFRRTVAALGLKGLPMAEIRLDLTPLGPAEIAAVFSRPIPMIATFRPGRASAADRAAALEAAIRAGAAYVDIEHDAAPDYRRRLVRTARARGCRVILSVHSGRRPPAAAELGRTRDALFRRGADIVKIVHRAASAGDCLRLFSLYDTVRRDRVIALGLGPAGVVTRLAAPLLGAPFTYTSLRPGRETADGQLDWLTMDRILRRVAHE